MCEAAGPASPPRAVVPGRPASRQPLPALAPPALSRPPKRRGRARGGPGTPPRRGPLGLVAPVAGGDEIVELVRAAPAARDDVVDGRRAFLVEGLAAVGTEVPVTFDQRGDDVPGPPFAGVVAAARALE